MFESHQQLQKFMGKITKSVPKFKILVGDHCARLHLDDTHGKRTAADRNGHFDFYEYAHFDTKSAVLEVTALEL